MSSSTLKIAVLSAGITVLKNRKMKKNKKKWNRRKDSKKQKQMQMQMQKVRAGDYSDYTESFVDYSRLLLLQPLRLLLLLLLLLVEYRWLTLSGLDIGLFLLCLSGDRNIGNSDDTEK